jgi:predicted ester cyclase
LGDLLTDDYVEHEPGRAELTGVDGAAVAILRFRAAFPDAMFIIDDVGVDSDRVWVRGRVIGTHTGLYVLPDGAIVPPSGVALRMEMIATARFEAGQIAELWMQADWLSTLTEIGAVGQRVQPNASCDALMQQAGSLMAQARVILDSGEASIAVLVMREAEKLAAPCAEPAASLTAGSSKD